LSWRHWTSRRLVIRSYLVLAGGLMLTALSLDLLFSRHQEEAQFAPDAWVESTFHLVESRLGALPPAERGTELARLERITGLPVTLLGNDELGARAPEGLQVLLNSSNQPLYLQWSPALDASIRIGPLAEEAAASGVSRLLPMLFYGSILLIVGLWLSPLLRDMNLLTEASRRFATDYREPLRTAVQVTQLQPLARNLDDMSARLSHLIRNQKELTAALSHEMRTPLARIRFASAVIGNEADEKLRSQLEGINQDVNQLDRLIAGLLEHARLDHPDMRMDWQEVVLRDWLQHVLDASATQDRVVSMELADSAAVVSMDPRLMGLAISNLVANACRHARRQVRVSASRSQNGVQISVEDDGPGIPVDRRSEIFRAFKTLESVREGATGGFGLGLAIVARVAALHGGQANAGESADLGGARLVVEWPLTDHR
jgi:signal transduction histidine kinase